MTYRQILSMTKYATTQDELQEARRQANSAELAGDLSMTEVASLTTARAAMRRALRCRTFTAVHRLELAYEKLHPELGGFFFEWLLCERRMKLFYASEFGKGVHKLFKTHPKLVLANVDSRITVSGRGQ